VRRNSQNSSKLPLKPVDQLVHLLADTRHLGEAELVDLLGREAGRGVGPQQVGVPGLAVRQVAHGDRLAGAGHVGLGQIGPELPQGRRHLAFENAGRLAPEPLPVGGGDLLGDLLEGFEHRALQRVAGEQVVHLAGNVAQSHPRRSDPLLEPLAEEGDGLVDHPGERSKASQPVLEILDGTVGHAGQEEDDPLVDAIHLVDQEVLPGKCLSFGDLLKAPERQVVVNLLGQREPRTVDRGEGRQFLAGDAAIERARLG
jgi:hypothetical protein